MTETVWFRMRTLLASLALALAVAGCSGGGVPVTNPPCTTTLPELPRAPEGDSLCAGRPNCESTGGQPDHQGCPNTCGCVCYVGLCYQAACTAIAGCTEPPVYR
jgi:hypothetical protein